MLSVIDKISEVFRTSMKVSDMTKLISNQIEDNKSWNIYQTGLDGATGRDFAYESGDNESIMYPSEEMIEHAKWMFKDN